jgi:hypothetical protein
LKEGRQAGRKGGRQEGRKEGREADRKKGGGRKLTLNSVFSSSTESFPSSRVMRALKLPDLAASSCVSL